jgi:hypothetical protein
MIEFVIFQEGESDFSVQIPINERHLHFETADLSAAFL